jgi:hypothetical protein
MRTWFENAEAQLPKIASLQGENDALYVFSDTSGDEGGGAVATAFTCIPNGLLSLQSETENDSSIWWPKLPPIKKRSKHCIDELKNKLKKIDHPGLYIPCVVFSKTTRNVSVPDISLKQKYTEITGKCPPSSNWLLRQERTTRFLSLIIKQATAPHVPVFWLDDDNLITDGSPEGSYDKDRRTFVNSLINSVRRLEQGHDCSKVHCFTKAAEMMSFLQIRPEPEVFLRLAYNVSGMYRSIVSGNTDEYKKTIHEWLESPETQITTARILVNIPADRLN